jgi:hypothetical protein
MLSKCLKVLEELNKPCCAGKGAVILYGVVFFCHDTVLIQLTFVTGNAYVNKGVNLCMLST